MIDRVFSFKSFYFSLGTTSFRMQNFNKKIELQLELLSKFWQKSEFENQQWARNENVQEAYYDFMQDNGFLKKGEAPRKAKDARQKTSGLRDLGLIDDNRRLTDVGKKILDISKSGDFGSDNLLQIPKDSFVYFQQLLKTYVEVNKGVYVRPYVVLLRLLNKFQFLYRLEFMYLFPMCIDEETTNIVEEYICRCRRRTTLRMKNWNPPINNVLMVLIMRQKNYMEARNYFIGEQLITEDTFCKVGLNRKSKEYDKLYFPLYRALKKICIENDRSDEIINELFCSIRALTNVSTHWWIELFGDRKPSKIKAELKNSAFPLWPCQDEEAFKAYFFNLMHLIKTKRTLEDYYDLNVRYLKISDTILFANSRVELDIVPKHYFSTIPDDFYNIAFKKSDNIFELQALNEISPYLNCSEKLLLDNINFLNNKHFSRIGEIKQFVVDEKIQRFNTLIRTKFTNKRLIEILNLFKIRKDKEIKKLVTDNADIPTIYEYITAIAWYKISGQQGDIFSFMNLSLDADLLPKTHAAGGEADLIFQYEKNKTYPKHSLLIEVTLSDSTNQRRMEMEPVSRHLGDYVVAHNEHESYCVFLTNYLHLNVISDFRNRRNAEYYGGKNLDTVIHGMMIIPLENDLLVSILDKNIKYEELYKLFHEAFSCESAPKEWYKELESRIYNLPSRCDSCD